MVPATSRAPRRVPARRRRQARAPGPASRSRSPHRARAQSPAWSPDQMSRATIMAMHSATARRGCRPPCDRMRSSPSLRSVPNAVVPAFAAIFCSAQRTACGSVWSSGPWEGSVRRRRTTTRKPPKTQHGSTTKPQAHKAASFNDPSDAAHNYGRVAAAQ
jgi:hypothetical protein